MQDTEQRSGTESRIEVRAPAGLVADLRAIGSTRERTLSQEVRWALTQHVEREREQSTAH